MYMGLDRIEGDEKRQRVVDASHSDADDLSGRVNPPPRPEPAQTPIVSGSEL